MNSRAFVNIAFLMMVLGLASGCNDTTFVSGLEPEKELVDLTIAEQELYCDSLTEFVSDVDVTDMVRSIVCRTMGIAAMFGDLSSEDAASIGIAGGTCEDVYSQCMAATDLEGFEVPEFPCSEGDWASCNITVGELEACITELTTLLDETEDLLSCDILGMASSMSSSTFESIAQVENCMAVAGGCAGFLPTVETDLDESGD